MWSGALKATAHQRGFVQGQVVCGILPGWKAVGETLLRLLLRLQPHRGHGRGQQHKQPQSSPERAHGAWRSDRVRPASSWDGGAAMCLRAGRALLGFSSSCRRQGCRGALRLAVERAFPMMVALMMDPVGLPLFLPRPTPPPPPTTHHHPPCAVGDQTHPLMASRDGVLSAAPCVDCTDACCLLR